MKKRIIIVFVILSALLLGGGTVAVLSLAGAAERLDKLILLHEVEILREDLIIRVEQVQSYIYRNKITSGGDVDTLNARVLEMDRAMKSCLGCHHSPERTQGLLGMNDVAVDYKRAISRLVTASANSLQTTILERRAQDLGRDLIAMTQGMAFTANVGLRQKTQDVLSSVRRIEYILYATVGIGLLLAAASVYYLVSRMGGLLAPLLDATKRVSQGEYSHRLEVPGHADSEFRLLGDAFNAMTRNLTLTMQRLERGGKFSAAGDLAAALSRELTPALAGMHRMSGAFLAVEAITAEQKEQLRALEQSMVYVRGILDTLQAFSQQNPPNPAKTDITALLRDTIVKVQQEARNRRIEIVFDCPADLPSLTVDAVQMKQVFLSLADNAMRAMPEGGTLTLKCRQSKDYSSDDIVVVEYRDTGRGFVDEQLRKKFDPLFTVHKEGEETNGSLALSYLTVQNHGGRIEAESNEGKGSVFRVILPA